MSGVKGKSGRKPNWVKRTEEELKTISLDFLIRSMNDPACPIDFKRSASLAVSLKGMTNKNETAVKLLADNDRLILGKYDKALEDNRLGLITGTTAGESIRGMGGGDGQ